MVRLQTDQHARHYRIRPSSCEGTVQTTRWTGGPASVPLVRCTFSVFVAVSRSLADKLQYEAKEYLEILHELIGITKSHPELLSTVGLCNFDAEHTEEICKYLIDRTGEVGIVSNQVQVRPVRSANIQIS